MTIRRLVPWVQQPTVLTEIDHSNPITKGLALLWNAGEQARPKVTGSTSRAYLGAGYAKTGGKSFSPLAFTGSWDVVHYNGLTGLRNAASGTGYIDVEAASLFNPDLGDYSFFSIRRFHSTTIDHSIVGLDATGQLQIWADTAASQIKLNIYDGVTVSSAGATSLNDTTRNYSIGFTFKDGVHDAKGYIDGLNAVEDLDFHPGPATDGNLQLNATEDINKIGDQSIYLFALWDRTLSPAEMWYLYVNPWQLFQPRTVMMPVGVAAAAAGSIINQMQGSNLGADLYNGTIL